MPNFPQRLAHLALLPVLWVCLGACAATRVESTGEVPSIHQLALATLPSRYELQVVDALRAAGVEVVPRSRAAYELVVYLRASIGDPPESAPPATNGWGAISGDSLTDPVVWIAVGVWTLISLLTLPDSASGSAQAAHADSDRPLLVQLVRPRSRRVVWSCSVVTRTRWFARSGRGSDGDRAGLDAALVRFTTALRP